VGDAAQEFTQETAIVVDELALVRAGIVAQLRDKGIEIVAETRSGREAASLAATERADLIVVGTPADLLLADTVRRLVALQPQPAIVALIAPAHEHETRYLLAMGARGIGLRTAEPDELGYLVDAALKGVQYVAPALHAALSGALKPPPLADREDALLTSREREVLVLLAEGRTNREIARALSVTLATVKSHLVHLYAKLDASNRNQALGRAVSLGLLR
jgi:DNA-binding NarL/FixJ family response regulator